MNAEFVCSDCGKKFSSKKHLQIHSFDHDASEIKSDKMFHEFGLPMTLKIHVIYHHYKGYFHWTQKTMKFTNGEFTETAHSVFKTSERTHNFKVNRRLGTTIHEKKSVASLIWHNSRRAGLNPLDKFRIRQQKINM